MSNRTPGPWTWEVMDHSCAVLAGPEGWMEQPVLDVKPCRSCQESADPKEWEWGRCVTPNISDAHLIAAAPDLLEECEEALLQIEYLHGRFQSTSSSEAVMARLRAAIWKAKGEANA